MNYSERLICFVDILGFKSIVERSLRDDELKHNLYELLKDLQSDKIKDKVYGDIPYFDGQVARVRDAYDGDHVDELTKTWPLEISQFSDSFVVSCSSSNFGSCSLLLRTLYYLNLRFFWELGVLLRGGIAMGELVHDSEGALFGPAMNEAYFLESNRAIYPRIVVSKDVADHLLNKFRNDGVIEPMTRSFDGFHMFDLISIRNWNKKVAMEDGDFYATLVKMEESIIKTDPSVHPKIAYLVNRLSESKT